MNITSNQNNSTLSTAQCWKAKVTTRLSFHPRSIQAFLIQKLQLTHSTRTRLLDVVNLSLKQILVMHVWMIFKWQEKLQIGYRFYETHRLQFQTGPLDASLGSVAPKPHRPRPPEGSKNGTPRNEPIITLGNLVDY